MQLDLKQRAVLGAFIQFPHWTRLGVKGLRPTHIWKIAPRTFKTFCHTGPGDSPLPAVLSIAMTCKGLCKLGFMVEIGRVKARFLPGNRDSRQHERDRDGYVTYDSPVYAPTESGLLWLMTQLDWSHLPDVKAGGRLRHRDTLDHSLTRTADFSNQFEKLIRLSPKEAYEIKKAAGIERERRADSRARATQRKRDEARNKSKAERAAAKAQEQQKQGTE